jgi:hypothetical protein
MPGTPPAVIMHTAEIKERYFGIDTVPKITVYVEILWE